MEENKIKHNAKFLEAVWTRYKKLIVDDNAPESVVRIAKYAFYMGISSASIDISYITSIFGNKGLVVYCHQVQDEIDLLILKGI